MQAVRSRARRLERRPNGLLELLNRPHAAGRLCLCVIGLDGLHVCRECSLESGGGGPEVFVLNNPVLGLVVPGRGVVLPRVQLFDHKHVIAGFADAKLRDTLYTLLPWGRAAWFDPRQLQRTKRAFIPPLAICNEA